MDKTEPQQQPGTAVPSGLTLRRARLADAPGVSALVEASIRGLAARHYSAQQVESSLVHLFGVDTQMIADGTYFVVEADGQIVGAGGWSRRWTPYGGDQAAALRDASLRDPAQDAAAIRAFYVHPAWARQGIGRLLLDASEAAARQAGYTRFELVSTLSGQALYTGAGYRAAEPLRIALPDGVVLDGTRMVKP